MDTRAAVGLNASIVENERAILIDFDYLDQGDGGMFEILYQGNGTLIPSVTGSIRGVPNGLRRPNLRGFTIDHGVATDEESRGGWKGLGVLFALLTILTVASVFVLSPGKPLSVILMTLSGLALLATVLATLTAAFAHLFLRWALGVPGILNDSWYSLSNGRLVKKGSEESSHAVELPVSSEYGLHNGAGP
jgi:hypothetical protein